MATQRLQSLLSAGPGPSPWIDCSTERRASALSASASSVQSVRFGVANNKDSLLSVSFSKVFSAEDHLNSCRTLSGYDRRCTGVRGIARAALFPFVGQDKEKVKFELLTAIAPLSRGATATPDNIARVDQMAQELEKLNPTREPLKSPLLNGKWKLIYTTSESVLKPSRPQILRPNGAIYQAINTDTLRAQNLETWPFFNQVTANLEPVNAQKVVVKFDYFKIGGLIRVKAPGRAQGELEITYLDDALRLSRGDMGNLFVLVMEDPDYRVPL